MLSEAKGVQLSCDYCGDELEFCCEGTGFETYIFMDASSARYEAKRVGWTISQDEKYCCPSCTEFNLTKNLYIIPDISKRPFFKDNQPTEDENGDLSFCVHDKIFIYFEKYDALVDHRLEYRLELHLKNGGIFEAFLDRYQRKLIL